MKLFLDGGSYDQMIELQNHVDGFTTNPSLIRSLGVEDYRSWCQQAIDLATGKPISIEVISEEDHEVIRQANTIASWGENVWVKVPIVKSDGTTAAPVIRLLLEREIKVNVTAILNQDHLSQLFNCLGFDLMKKQNLILSVFAGRIADTMQDPVETFDFIDKHFALSAERPQTLWASTREIYNYEQARKANVDIITMNADMVRKMTRLSNAPLDIYAKETSAQFLKAAQDAGYTI